MKSKKIFLIFIALIVLMAAMFAGYYMGRRNIAVLNIPDSRTVGTKEYLFSTDEIVANLNNPDNRSYIKVNIYLGYSAKNLETELTDKKPQIRDTIIDILRSKKVADLNSQKSIERMKSEISNNVNKILTKGKVSSVYFNDILVQ